MHDPTIKKKNEKKKKQQAFNGPNYKLFSFGHNAHSKTCLFIQTYNAHEIELDLLK